MCQAARGDLEGDHDLVEQPVSYWRLVWIGFVFLLVLWLLASAEHTPALRWMVGYRNAAGMGCCNEIDCRPAHVRLLGSTGIATTVLVSNSALKGEAWITTTRSPEGQNAARLNQGY